MPLKLLVRAEDSPTYPQPGAWQKGDIIAVLPDTWVFGNKETLPLFVRIRISNTNNGDLGWLQPGTGGDTINRRSARVNPAEIDAIKASWPTGTQGPAPSEVHVSYTRQIFNSKMVTKV